MITKKCLIVPLAAIAITFSSEIALAVEKTNSGSSSLLWSLVALVAVLLFFGKQLLADAFPKPQETSSEESAEEEIPVVVPVVEQVKKQTETPVVKVDDTKTEEITDEVKIKSVDLKEGRKRCQAVTAKGTRCKRRINLENASITIDGINYDLTICRQHKSTGFKPFPKLIK